MSPIERRVHFNSNRHSSGRVGSGQVRSAKITRAVYCKEIRCVRNLMRSFSDLRYSDHRNVEIPLHDLLGYRIRTSE